MYHNLSEASRKHVPGVLGGTITDVGHNVHSLKLPPDSVVDTFRFTPIPGQLVVPITLVTGELLCPLLDNLRLGGWSNSHG